MNRNVFLNFIFTVLTAAVIFLGIMLINAIDRVQLSNQQVLRKLSEISDSLQRQPMINVQTATTGKTAEATLPPKAEIANVAYYDQNAQRGGRMITVIPADTGNMNNLINNDSTVSMFYEKCNSTLAERDYKTPEAFKPLMAESWTISPDKKVYDIKLRKGILWQDFTDPVTGKEWKDREVTAQDFKFYVDVIKNPDTNCAPMRVYFKDLEKVEIISDYEFKVYWKERYFGSIEQTLSLSPLPRHLYHAYEGPFDGKRFNDDHQRNRIIIGCGPYRFLRWDKDLRVIFTSFEKYFGRQYGITPPLKDICYDIIKHPNTQFQALLSGSIDRLGMTPEQWTKSETMKEFDDKGTIRKLKYLGRSYSYIGYNLRNPLFKDKQVRQALTHLVNREKILKDVYSGLAEIISGPCFYNSPYYDKSITLYPFDVAKAKTLLAQAGWKDTDGDGILDKDGRKFEFSMLQVANHPIQEKMLPIIKEDMAKAGIDMKIQILEWSVYIQRLEQQNFEVCVLGWTIPYEVDPYQVWHSSQADVKFSSNHIGFKNAEADRIIEELRRTFDISKRIELCHQFQKLLHEEQPYTFLFAPYSLLALSKRYQNVHKFPLGVQTEIMWTPKSQQLQIPGL